MPHVLSAVLIIFMESWSRQIICLLATLLAFDGTHVSAGRLGCSYSSLVHADREIVVDRGVCVYVCVWKMRLRSTAWESGFELCCS